MSAAQPPVSARPAATVLLLRDTEAGLEVFLQRRVKAMAFAASMTVFPGGGVDERDQAVSEAAWSGPPPSWWAARLGCAEPLATGLVGAAVRETFEECGVLLAGAPDGSPLETDAELLATTRDDLAARRSSLAETLTAHGWTLRADLLRPWSNWITPEAEPRRYDTRFFVAGLPSGQRADDGTTEVSEAGWWRPVDALDAWRADRIQMLPPTWISLEQIAELPDVAAALHAADQRQITPVMPELRKDGDQVSIALPAGLGHDSELIRLRPRPRPSTPASPEPASGSSPAGSSSAGSPAGSSAGSSTGASAGPSVGPSGEPA